MRGISAKYITTGFLFVFLILGSVSIAQSLKTYSLNDTPEKRFDAILLWTGIISEESDIATILKGDTKLLSVLLEDKNFVPVFGKPYSTLSLEERERIYKSLNNLFPVAGYAQGAKMLRAVIKLFELTNDTFSVYDREQKKLVEKTRFDGYLSDLEMRIKNKKGYDAMFKTLLTGTYITKPNLNVYRDVTRRNIFLLSQEKKILLDLIDRRDVELVTTKDTLFQSQIEGELQRPMTFESAVKIEQYRRVGNFFLIGPGRDNKERAQKESQKLQYRITEILIHLVKEEKGRNLSNLPASEESILQINIWYDSLKNRFEYFSVITAALKPLSERKAEILKILMPAIVTKISKSSISNLIVIEKTYLNFELFSEEITKNLNASIKKRRWQIALEDQQKINSESTVKITAALKFDGLTYSGLFEAIYLRDFAELDASKYGVARDGGYDPVYFAYVNMFCCSFIAVVVQYGDQCRLLSGFEQIDYYAVKEIKKHFPGYPNNIIETTYEYSISKSIFIEPKYMDSYFDACAARHEGSKIGEHHLVKGKYLRMENYVFGDIDFSPSIVNDISPYMKDVEKLIKQNGCNHPGIKLLMQNFSDYIASRRR